MGVRGVLDDIALVAQLTGLHAIMLIVLAARLLRILECKAECAKLEESTRRLGALLQWSAGGVATQLAAMAGGALVVADDLVETYRRSTLWRRVRTGRSMEARLRDARNSIDSLCALLLCVHAILLAVHPASDTNVMNHHVMIDPLYAAEARDSVSDSQSYNSGTVQGEAADDQSDSTEPGGFESVV